jgi:hypothetical protein
MERVKKRPTGPVHPATRRREGVVGVPEEGGGVCEVTTMRACQCQSLPNSLLSDILLHSKDEAKTYQTYNTHTWFMSASGVRETKKEEKKRTQFLWSIISPSACSSTWAYTSSLLRSEAKFEASAWTWWKSLVMYQGFV